MHMFTASQGFWQRGLNVARLQTTALVNYSNSQRPDRGNSHHEELWEARVHGSELGRHFHPVDLVGHLGIQF
jgi:hypothetical protein